VTPAVDRGVTAVQGLVRFASQHGGMIHDTLNHRRWPLEPQGDPPPASRTSTVERVVRPAVRRGDSPWTPGGSWTGSWERRQLRRAPLLALLVCWIVAAITQAPVAHLFMWLLFATLVGVALLSLLERVIHCVDMWNGRQAGRW
jgi:hypothetical protein